MFTAALKQWQLHDCLQHCSSVTGLHFSASPSWLRLLHCTHVRMNTLYTVHMYDDTVYFIGLAVWCMLDLFSDMVSCYSLPFIVPVISEISDKMWILRVEANMNIWYPDVWYHPHTSIIHSHLRLSMLWHFILHIFQTTSHLQTQFVCLCSWAEVSPHIR